MAPARGGHGAGARGSASLAPALRRAGVSCIALMVLALTAGAVGAYLTAVHYAGIPPVCTAGGVVDCAAVTQSSYSLVPGTAIPVTVPGLLWAAVSAALAAMALLRARQGRPEPSWLRPAHALWAAAAMVPVLYLVYAEAVPLHRLCEWCTVVHLAVFASLLLTLQRLRPPVVDGPAARSPGDGRRWR